MRSVIRLTALALVFLLSVTCIAFAANEENEVHADILESDSRSTGSSDRVVNTYVLYENNEPYVGDEVILVAELAGFKEGAYKIQWQYSPDGEEWYDAEGATQSRYSFLLTFDNIGYHWRVKVEDTGR